MKIKRMLGGAAAAVVMFGLNGVAQANHDACVAEAEEIKYYADVLICAARGGQWDYDPIWQFQGKKGDGCEVHDKLAKQLYVTHDSPPDGRGKGKGFREAQGAANALLDHKFEDALHHLQNFQDTIEFSAKLNPDPDAVFGKKADGTDYTAADRADHWKSWAAAMQQRVAACMPAP